MQEVEIRKEKSELYVKIKTEIDHHSAKSIREQIDKALSLMEPGVLILDFSEVSFMDSSGIGLVLGRVDRCESINAKIRLVGLVGVIKKLIKMSGIERLDCISVVYD